LSTIFVLLGNTHSNPDLKLIRFLLLSVNYSTYLFRNRLCIAAYPTCPAHFGFHLRFPKRQFVKFAYNMSEENLPVAE